MNLELVGKDLHPSEALRERIEQKLTKIEARIGHKIFVRCALKKEATTYTSTVHFTASRREFTATAVGEDLFKSADEAIAKVDRQVRKTLSKGDGARKSSESIRTIDTESDDVAV